MHNELCHAVAKISQTLVETVLLIFKEVSPEFCESLELHFSKVLTKVPAIFNELGVSFLERSNTAAELLQFVFTDFFCGISDSILREFICELSGFFKKRSAVTLQFRKLFDDLFAVLEHAFEERSVACMQSLLPSSKRCAILLWASENI